MASLDLKQIDYTLVIRRARPISLKVGTQGPRGSSGAAVSTAPDNQIKIEPDGLFVPSILASTQW